MTYLQVVNNVLRRLRENEVTSVSDTRYSKMVGDYVNDALSLVEDAWDWTQLRQVVDIATVDGTDTYTLTGSGQNPKVLSVYNNGRGNALERATPQFMDFQKNSTSATSGSPRFYSFRGYDSGNARVEVHPTPEAVETLRFNVVVRQGLVTADATEIKVPVNPVIHLAIALLARERGETGGTSTAEYFTIADRHLSDAIQMDYRLVEGELDWNAGYVWESNTVN